MQREAPASTGETSLLTRVSERPAFSYLFSNFPAELRDSKFWVLWRMEDTKDKSGKERKKAKAPKRVSNPKIGADHGDPATWSTFQEAIAALPNLPAFPTYPAVDQRGIGCCIAGGYVGVDLDDAGMKASKS